MPRKRLIDEQPGFPFRIGEIRTYVTLLLADDWFAEDIVTCIREMRRCLADPKVPDQLRAGDQDVLKKLLGQLAERWRYPPNPDTSIQHAKSMSGGQILH